MTVSMTASSVAAAVLKKPAKFQNIRRFAPRNEEKALSLILSFYLATKHCSVEMQSFGGGTFIDVSQASLGLFFSPSICNGNPTKSAVQTIPMKLFDSVVPCIFFIIHLMKKAQPFAENEL